MKKVKAIITKLKRTVYIKTTEPNYRTIRSFTLLFLALLTTTIGFASDVETQLNSWATSIDTSMTILVGIYAVIGSFLVFVQYMQGSEQAQKNLIKFVIGLAVFGIAKALTATFTPTAP